MSDPACPLPESNRSDNAYYSVSTDLPPIRLIDFDEYKKLDYFPRYPENKDICVELSSIDRSCSLIVFISHAWLRGWSGADGWDGRPHPDNARGDKHKLCVSGLQEVLARLAPGMSKAYIWLDFGCMDQDGNPAGELKQLDEIVRSCDCIFTPVADDAALPSSYSNLYDDYHAAGWNGPQHGYINRCWCRYSLHIFMPT